MENNKTCPNCGNLNEENAKFCANCGKELIQDNQSIEKNDSYLGTILGIISIVLCLSGIICKVVTINDNTSKFLRNIYTTIEEFGALVGIVIIIIGRLQYPKNKTIKVAIWLVKIFIILFYTLRLAIILINLLYFT